MIFDTISDEIYALLVVEQINPGILNDVRKWESPDWKDDADFMGLEVTRAQTTHIGYTNNVVAKYLGQPKEQIPANILENFKGYMEFRNGKLFLVSDSKGLVNGNRHVAFLLEHLKAKLQKLNGPHFSVCQHNYLFEYGISHFSESDKYEFAQGIRDEYVHYLHVFEKIIVGTYDEVVCFYGDGTFANYTVPVYDLTRLTGQYREVIERKNGILFSEVKKIINLTDDK